MSRSGRMANAILATNQIEYMFQRASITDGAAPIPVILMAAVTKKITPGSTAPIRIPCAYLNL